ncbi:anti-sigma factor [Membranihabitans marinus]|uniref:hypothetical protein n=1 Tax=Membranihabitans marinus TaxID=1227546 RepID=UPI001F2E2CF9|nr:hypothetical protein [Membranihabitans marinus]
MKKKFYNSDIQEQISLFLDNALEPDQKIEFINTMESDPIVSQAVEKEKTFRKLIKSKFSAPKLGPDFVQGIKNKLPE